METELETIRKEIDAIDDQILDLLQKRCALCRSIAHIKRAGHCAIHDPSREAAILARLTARTDPSLGADVVERIFTEIFSLSRQIQHHGENRAR